MRVAEDRVHLRCDLGNVGPVLIEIGLVPDKCTVVEMMIVLKRTNN